MKKKKKIMKVKVMKMIKKNKKLKLLHLKKKNKREMIKIMSNNNLFQKRKSGKKTLQVKIKMCHK